MKPKFKVGEYVITHPEASPVKVLEVQAHGKGICPCCWGKLYYLYRISSNLWLNGESFKKVTVS